MQYGRCTSLPDECPKAGQTIEVPEGDDFVCPECETDLMAVARKPSLGERLHAVPPGAKLLALALPLLGLLGFGVYQLLPPGGDSSGGEVVSSTRAVPPVDLVEEELQNRLPEGYALAGDPALDPSASSGPVYRYRVPLRAEGEGYEVPIVDLRPHASMPEPLRESAEYFVVDLRLPAGKTYDTRAAQPASITEVEGDWWAKVERTGGVWRVVEAGPVEVSSVPGIPENAAFLTRAELDGFEASRDRALAEYEARWEAVRGDIENFRAEALRGVPSRCTKDTAPLLKEVVAMTSKCPKISDEARRNDCFLRRDRLNSEIGECETQNRLHQEGMAKANRAVADYRGKRLEAFRRELERQARAYSDGAGSYAGLAHGG